MKSFSVSVPVDEILTQDFRLDATYYASNVYQARKVLEANENEGIKIKTLKDVTKTTFNPPPIKRVYTDNHAIGTPYMLPQEMFNFYWVPRKYVLADKMDKIEDWFLKKNWIVLTQSGSAGKPYFTTEQDEQIVMSQNAIRIIPEFENDAGYFFAYIMTWIGQSLLRKDEFGITVKHIRPNQVDKLKIPWIDPKARKKIHEKVKKAFELRAKANKELKEAVNEVYLELNAPTEASMNEEEG